jgi:hypothetical protein
VGGLLAITSDVPDIALFVTITNLEPRNFPLRNRLFLYKVRKIKQESG